MRRFAWTRELIALLKDTSVEKKIVLIPHARMSRDQSDNFINLFKILIPFFLASGTIPIFLA